MDVLIMREGGMLVAQAIQIDVAAQAWSVETLERRFCRSLTKQIAARRITGAAQEQAAPQMYKDRFDKAVHYGAWVVDRGTRLEAVDPILGPGALREETLRAANREIADIGVITVRTEVALPPTQAKNSTEPPDQAVLMVNSGFDVVVSSGTRPDHMVTLQQWFDAGWRVAPMQVQRLTGGPAMLIVQRPKGGA